MRLLGLRRKALEGFEADLAILFGARFADPDYTTFDGVQFIVAGDDFDELATFEPEAASETESIGRTVHDEAGDAVWLRAEIDDYAGTLSHDSAFGAAAIACGEGGQCFVLGEEFHDTPIMGRVP